MDGTLVREIMNRGRNKAMSLLSSERLLFGS